MIFHQKVTTENLPTKHIMRVLCQRKKITVFLTVFGWPLFRMRYFILYALHQDMGFFPTDDKMNGYHMGFWEWMTEKEFCRRIYPVYQIQVNWMKFKQLIAEARP